MWLPCQEAAATLRSGAPGPKAPGEKGCTGFLLVRFTAECGDRPRCRTSFSTEARIGDESGEPYACIEDTSRLRAAAARMVWEAMGESGPGPAPYGIGGGVAGAVYDMPMPGEWNRFAVSFISPDIEKPPAPPAASPAPAMVAEVEPIAKPAEGPGLKVLGDSVRRGLEPPPPKKPPPPPAGTPKNG
mmetsp:Transcript_77687/g.161426  ORF Transcript_77687/g.161426 Transcript_77687/m.161426 type:complete len:187 (+) Transcript_77687:1805-2365(+)